MLFTQCFFFFFFFRYNPIVPSINDRIIYLYIGDRPTCWALLSCLAVEIRILYVFIHASATSRIWHKASFKWIDFNGMSTRLGCLEIRESCTLKAYIYIFCCCSLNLFCTQLYDIKYSYLILIIYTQINGFTVFLSKTNNYRVSNNFLLNNLFPNAYYFK